MSRKFIAAVLAASFTVTTFAAAPARADNQDVARVIGTAATLFIIGSAIANAQTDDNRLRVQVHDPRNNKRYDQRQDLPRVIGRVHQPPKARVRHQPVLPRSCLLEVKGGGARYVMGKSCLKQNGWGTDSLPRRCRIEVRNHGKTQTAYTAGCLRESGFRLDGTGSRFQQRDDRGGWSSRTPRY